MSNPVENTLAGGHSQEDIEKLVQERVAQALAAQKKEQDEKDRLNVEALMAEEKKKQEERSKQEAVIREEAKRVAYLDSIKVDEIEDEAIRNTVSTIMAAATTSTEEKCKMVESLVTSSRVKSVLAKVDALSAEEQADLSQFSLNNLKNIAAKEHNLTKSDIEKAADAIQVIEEAIGRVTDKKISQAMNGKVDYDKLPAEKKLFYQAANMAVNVQKQRNEVLNKMREKLGVA